MTTVALLFTNYGPYHFARSNAAHRLFEQIGWQLQAIELSRSDTDYAWKAAIEQSDCPFVTIIQDQPLQSVKLRRLFPAVYESLARINPDVIAIAGYFQPGMLAALSWSRLNRKPAILLSASKEDDAARSGIKERLKQQLINQYQSALVGGQPQKRYLLKLGMRENQVFTGYNVVGNDAFHPDRLRSLPNPINAPFFLSINRFIQRKNILNLITAYATYTKQTANPWHLVLCGDGELRPQIEEQIQTLGLSDRIHLPGFLQQDELLPYFAHANCFVHASSQEQWGLVVNEAMAAGLPVLVSNRCGCFEDLVIEGVNGWGFEPDNVEQMTLLMSKISSSEDYAKTMGNAALAHIQNFSPRYFAQGLYQAVEYALKQS
ncbi:glycosyltransferase family 4 protein [Leptolyngbya sp. AN03gr2]|uniref:glycosyltransferase family 4 protein n=1 Tax=unclassified Leptolyngbya TaxID=2650499 RepID=UPI003D31F6CC